jgi:hypothetical protein
MKKYLIYVTLILIVQSCGKGQGQQDRVDLKKYDFIDSTKYRPGNKILVGAYSNSEHEVAIDVLRHANSEFQVIQTIGPLDSQFGDTELFFEDFNQDGLKDLKLKSGSGARGANTLFHLLIQDTTAKLNYVRGSTEIPNLEFDTTRKVIMGTYFYAGVSFVDFKLVKDSLIQISGVDVSADSVWTVREYYSIDDKGNRIIIKRDSVEDNGEGLYTREE